VPGGGRAEPTTVTEPSVVLYNRTKAHRSREFLKRAAAGESYALTPGSYARDRLAPGPYGQPREAKSVRSVIRSLRNLQNTLMEEGAIGREVVRANWDGYADDGSGRYYISEEDRRALDDYLASDGSDV
jgi:hypothetical protein